MIRNSEASRLQPSSPIASMKTIRAAFRSGFTTKLPVSQTRRFASAVGMRLFTFGLEGAETDLSETMARSIFEECATPYARQIEAEMRAAVEGAS